MPACIIAVASTSSCSAGLAPGRDVALEMRRNVDDEGELGGIEEPVDIADRDLLRRLEIGRQQRRP